MELKLTIPSELRRIAVWVLFLAAGIPLVVTNMTLFPSIFGKTVAIRLIVALFWILFSIHLLRKKPGSGNSWRDLDISFVKNPIFLSVAIYFLFSVVGTIFSVVPYKSLFGTVERGEGLILFIFLFFFLIGTLLVFKKREWLTFFKLTLITGLIISIDEIIGFAKGAVRPSGTFIGNPAFIAAYLLFVAFAAVMVLGSRQKRFWVLVSWGAILVSIAAFAIANTRGAFVGVAFGILAALLYLIARGKSRRVRIFRRKLSLRMLALFLLSAMVIFVATFIFTIDKPVWDKVPGLNRLTQISLEDATVQTRLITARVSLSSVKPAENGVGKFLFGWGLDNLNVAYNAHYDPAFQKYEALWFDRAHNKILDVLVMQGILGLILYLAIWYFIVRAIFKCADIFRRNDFETGYGRSANLIGAGALFFATAYFVQNLFLFDQITTYIPLFSFLGFMTFVDKENGSYTTAPIKAPKMLEYTSLTVAAGLTLAVVIFSFIPLYQMNVLISNLQTGSAKATFENIDSITKPYNYAQPEIRLRLADMVIRLIPIQEALYIVDRIVELEEEVLDNKPMDPRHLQVLAFIYDTRGRIYNQPGLFLRAEELYKEALELSPGRQEIMFLYAQNLLSQGRPEEAKKLARDILELEPEALPGQFYHFAILAPQDWNGEGKTLSGMRKLFMDDPDRILIIDEQKFVFTRNMYNGYLRYFYDKKDADSFLKTMEQALKIEKLLSEIQDYQLKEGLIGATFEIRVDRQEEGIRIFKERGWEGINPSQY